MASSNPPSTNPSRTSTPNPATASRFTAQASTAEDLLKSQTVGLVHLSDFRKRRAEALEQKEREAQDRSLGRFSGSATPASDGARTPLPPKKKRKAHALARGKLSFGDALVDGSTEDSSPGPMSTGAVTPGGDSSEDAAASTKASPAPEKEQATTATKKRLGPNSTVPVAPKAMTKSALMREAQTREQLRKEFLALQELVKATEILIPFVFYDGTNIPGGVCKVKKGDYAWLFLDKARKVGAELGVGGAGERASSRREWARVGVDDLMMVRGEIIIPHHYEFYYFIVNKTKGPGGQLLFDFSTQAMPASQRKTSPDSFNPLSKPSTKPKNSNKLGAADERLEGFDDDPNITKVVDRRWYERNKHIFPASVWEEFDPEKDYTQAVRRDTGGNAFFFR
ncbi:hypothetical protein FGG08_000152 [Glutinoglossum americanum]|uniref:FAM50A/XAP5 C-terminal domain-containing protein n=1 Tax=Glutinoglossum americanum TaxID=1670608 RepID=A0A9P8I9R2_9PEZI|nr:hypothetical protein FGG08_000152 [Glutinoglossum americanum]